MATSRVVLKLSFGSDTRKRTVEASSVTMEAVEQLARALFGVRTSVELTHVDAEHDRLPILSQADLDEAVMEAVALNRSLRLEVGSTATSARSVPSSAASFSLESSRGSVAAGDASPGGAGALSAAWCEVSHRDVVEGRTSVEAATDTEAPAQADASTNAEVDAADASTNTMAPAVMDAMTVTEAPATVGTETEEVETRSVATETGGREEQLDKSTATEQYTAEAATGMEVAVAEAATGMEMAVAEAATATDEVAVTEAATATDEVEVAMAGAQTASSSVVDAVEACGPDECVQVAAALVRALERHPAEVRVRVLDELAGLMMEEMASHEERVDAAGAVSAADEPTSAAEEGPGDAAADADADADATAAADDADGADGGADEEAPSGALALAPPPQPTAPPQLPPSYAEVVGGASPVPEAGAATTAASAPTAPATPTPRASTSGDAAVDDNVARLVDMGFGPEQALVALQANDGNVDDALEALIRATS